ncbi:ABC transporter ATP-binding protein/permease [Histidinibacterium lentulum]|uniref:ATP-binding cassette domain-containing protein n=1 Tax=Histidinibacterium lentulum TaxID=2480588 RepID=A0A3N2R7Q1_9RHOB|nr:ATP-binding cassette domain-containing protein [Histidinibacterium lentulum]ROU03484.1 ATP-binding cassette domain-containing protein [Histidinibacterium lentulum]
MTPDPSPDAPRPSPAEALAAFEAPARAALARAGALGIVAALLWPVQAYAVAASVHLWAVGTWNPVPGLWLVALFVTAGAARALLEARAGGIAHRAAEALMAAERERLIAAEAARVDRGTNSAAFAALLTQKLPLMVPYLVRYRPAFLRATVVPLTLVALTLPVSWAVALVLLVAIPLIPLFQALVGIAARDASAKQMDEIADLNGLLSERLSALPDLHLLDAGGRALSGFAVRAEALRRRTMAVLRVAFLSSTVLEFFSALGVALVAVYVGFNMLDWIGFGDWGQALTLAQGIFVLMLAPEVFQPLREVSAAWHDKATAEAVARDLAEVHADPGPRALGAGARAAPLPGPATLRVSGASVLRGAEKVPLPDMALSPGQAVALTGSSGTGKSSALLAIAGLVPVAAGRIEVAGRVLDDATADAWRARLAWVPQRVHVPDATLAEALDPRGTGADPAEALAAARAGAVVAGLPEGLATRLGENGAGVSGGEARRLMLARALLARPDVVLADEPTADLDAATAAAVRAALRRLAEGGALVIVATHDPVLVREMDRIVPMPGAARAA